MIFDKCRIFEVLTDFCWRQKTCLETLPKEEFLKFPKLGPLHKFVFEHIWGVLQSVCSLCPNPLDVASHARLDHILPKLFSWYNKKS